MKDNEIKALIGKTVNAEIQKFKNQIKEIFIQDLKSLDEKLAQVEVLIEEYTDKKENDDSRQAQIEHENNEPPLARNRVIIQAEIKAHKLNFDSDSNHHTKKSWEKKLAELEEELKNSPV